MEHFFGLWYELPGAITAGVADLAAGIIWCLKMSKLYATENITFEQFLQKGNTLGIILGAADGIFLNIVGISLYKAGYIHHDDLLPMTYSVGIFLGILFGLTAGLVNGLIWSITVAIMYKMKQSKAMASQV